jgi:hypothetical protein
MRLQFAIQGKDFARVQAGRIQHGDSGERNAYIHLYHYLVYNLSTLLP